MAEYVLGVSQLNEYVRRQLAADPVLRQVRVRGEVSGFKRHYSGHLYFSLKDQDAKVNCAMFRQHAMRLGFEPRDGMQVVVTASASLYVQNGAFQLYVEQMMNEGSGQLYVLFEQLKARLQDEGLFDPAIKKPLPLLPRRIGVVTSIAGAALQDILRVARRRMPGISILVASAAVQGDGAAQQIADALDALNQNGTVDVILCGRGGGSMEELWAFNEEVVARAIHRSKVPVVSCVGHETDFTIADFVSDIRAATPSMAAELAVPDRNVLMDQLQTIAADIRRSQMQRVQLLRSRLDRVAASPMLTRPSEMLLSARFDQLAQLKLRMTAAHEHRKSEVRGRINALSGSLAALNPAAVMERGYAVIQSGDRVLTDAKALKKNMQVRIRMQHGSADARIEQITLEGEHGEA
ncbi:exodeoxyribonuclease VII large subunit [Eubacteriales bacterium OttesenSCG-928-N13]|nr:exodeoxyribonuclease VII large subunit [Eubacteriales bacterium OttesenSCG-928-N13]